MFKLMALTYSVAMVGLVLWSARDVRYVYFLRVPLLTMLAVLGLQLIALLPAFSSMLENLFYGPSNWDSFWILLSAQVATSTAYITGQTVLRYGPMRFEGNAEPRNVPQFTDGGLPLAAVSIPVVPLFYVLLFKSQWDSLWPLVGFLGAVIASTVIYKLSEEVAPSVARRATKFCRRAGREMKRIPGGAVVLRFLVGSSEGYWDPMTSTLGFGHIRNAIFLVLVGSS
ncbi:MAG: hypothetical protein M3Y27_09955, partial [Acidobacteriota bacterium]|nr:hypothetical protein [Acidobacteriota bacterium]